MVWAFIAGSLGALAYICYLVMEHFRESTLVGDQIGRHRQLIDEAQVGVAEAERERDAARARCGQLEEEVKALQKSVDEVQALIGERKKEMAQRGRYRVG
jgi:peptidoglycan hydrolase CwlO-like protein